MKKAALLKLLEKYPANRDILFKTGENSFSSVRLEVENNYDVFETEYDEDNETDIPLKEPRVEKCTFVRLVLE